MFFNFIHSQPFSYWLICCHSFQNACRHLDISNPICLAVHVSCCASYCLALFRDTAESLQPLWSLLSPQSTVPLSLSPSLSRTHGNTGDYNRDLCQTSPILNPFARDVSWTETSGGETEQILSVFLFPMYRGCLSLCVVPCPCERE